MTKEELIPLLKTCKENKAKLKLRQREERMLKLRIKAEAVIETSLTKASEINSYIQSRNKISDKVGNAVVNSIVNKEEQIKKDKDRLKELETEIPELEEKVTEAEIRLESLYYKEREILTAYYVDNRTAEDIGQNLYFRLFNRTCSTQNVYKIIEKATNRLINL